MSTVAYKDNCLYADTQATRDGIKMVHTKCFRDHSKGIYIASVGSYQKSKLFADWYIKGQEEESKPNFESGDFEALVHHSGKLSHWQSDLVPVRLSKRVPIALGSGGHLATGAMCAGATAKQAVIIASKHDPYTNSKTEHFNLKGK